MNTPTWSSYQRVWYRPKIEKLLSLIVATFGFSWQMLIVSRIYFSYLTTAEINIVKSTKVIPPAITVCFQWSELRDDQLLCNNLSSDLMMTTEQRMKLVPYIDIKVEKRIQQSNKVHVTTTRSF